tara:strand:- start:148 stop:1719 length:1572 start_codon:yes stop_codon:yes gene_type:complete
MGSKSIVTGLVTDPLSKAVKPVLKKGASKLLSTIAPDLAKGVTPKFSFPNQPKWSEVVGKLSDGTLSSLSKQAETGADGVFTTQKLIDELAGGNAEPMLKFESAQFLHPEPPPIPRKKVGPEPPSVHNIKKEDRSDFLKELGRWLVKNEQLIHSGEIDFADFGPIIYDNKQYRISHEGAKNFLADSSRNVNHLKIKPIGGKGKEARGLQIDPGKIDVINQWLTSVNQLFSSGAKVKNKAGKNVRAGVNPAWLNPQTYRKSITQAGRLVRQMNSALRQLDPALAKIQQEHPIDLTKAKGTDDFVGMHSGSEAQNIALNRKDIGGAAFDQTAAEILGIPGGGMLDEAAKITGTGPASLQRKAEYEQFGWLQSITNRAIEAMETKGEGLPAAIEVLKQQRNALVRGEVLNVDLRLPGAKVTMSDMLLIQQMALKTGDAASAAETVLAERELLDRFIAAGLDESEKAVDLLAKYIKNIDYKMEIEFAVRKGRPFKEYKYEGTPIQNYPQEKFQKLSRGAAQPVNWKE